MRKFPATLPVIGLFLFGAGALYFARNVFRMDPLPFTADRQLMREVRRAIDSAVLNPGSIAVHVRDGRAKLRGPVLKAELKALLAAVYSVPGVFKIDDHLEVYETSEGVPGLQGHREPTLSSYGERLKH